MGTQYYSQAFAFAVSVYSPLPEGRRRPHRLGPMGCGGWAARRIGAVISRQNLGRALIEEQCVWLSCTTGCGGRYADGPVVATCGAHRWASATGWLCARTLVVEVGCDVVLAVVA